MTAELPEQLKADLETFGRLCALAMIQLGQGAPGMFILGGVRDMHEHLERLIPQLAANPQVFVRVNPRLGDAQADFLAEHLNPPAPDFIPDDL